MVFNYLITFLKKMKRQIIKIDEKKCNGCGVCIPNCHEGALQIIDGKARLISDLMCDGLGACIGHCPEEAIEVIEREAEPYNEIIVIEEMVKKGKNTVVAHLNHLKDHKEFGFFKQGIKWMQENRDKINFDVDEVIAKVHNGAAVKEKAEPVAAHAEHAHHHHHGGGCPGSLSQAIDRKENILETPVASTPSQLNHWPVQMHLINPASEHFQHSDLLLAADCVAFSMGNFHQDFLKGKTLAIACPKLDSNKEVYIQKLISLIEEAKINTITIMKMEVPCCGGIVQMAQIAQKQASRKVPIKTITVSISGQILTEEWI